MDYIYFLTSLEINSKRHFYNWPQEFSTPINKSESDFEFQFKTYTPQEAEFDIYSRILDVNQEYSWYGITYVHHLPITIKMEKAYFKLADKSQELATFIDNLLTLYQYVCGDFGLPTYKLDGRKIFYKIKDQDSWEEYSYTSMLDTDFFGHLAHSIFSSGGSLSLIGSLASKKIPLEPNWALFIDGIKFFYDGNFRQTLISCCTCIEITVTEPVRLFLESLIFNKGKSLVENLIKEIGNPLRFEIYIHTINSEPYKIYDQAELATLIKDLKELNTIRNKVAHTGFLPSRDQAKNAIDAASKFLKTLWLYKL